MKDDSAKEELLSDVLGETVSDSFRANSLDQMLAVVQRRRANRKRVQGLVAGACILLIITFGLRFHPKQSVALVQRADPMLVHSAPLSPGTLIDTQAGVVTFVNSSGPSFALVEAIPSEDLFERIGEDRLMALLASRPAALIHRGTSSELVFLDPADANGYQVR